MHFIRQASLPPVAASWLTSSARASHESEIPVLFCLQSVIEMNVNHLTINNGHIPETTETLHPKIAVETSNEKYIQPQPTSHSTEFVSAALLHNINVLNSQTQDTKTAALKYIFSENYPRYKKRFHKDLTHQRETIHQQRTEYSPESSSAPYIFTSSPNASYLINTMFNKWTLRNPDPVPPIPAGP